VYSLYTIGNSSVNATHLKVDSEVSLSLVETEYGYFVRLHGPSFVVFAASQIALIHFNFHSWTTNRAT